MERMDFYRKESKSHILMEGTLKKMFEKFKKGESNEDIMKEYASRGIKIPETFMSKIRKQYEEVKKLQLEIEFSEQETADMFKVPEIVPVDSPELKEKQLASGLFKEAIIKKYVKESLQQLKEESEILIYRFNEKCRDAFGPDSYYVLGSHEGDGIHGTIRCVTGAVGGEMTLSLKQDPTKLVNKGDQARPSLGSNKIKRKSKRNLNKI